MEFQKSHSSLQGNPLLDGLDRRLVHALQVHPRVAWVDLGCVLAVDPAQLSRRWARLVREGAAWTSCYPGLTARGSGGDSAALALIELTVTGGERDAVIDELGALPEIFSLECTSGSRDLLATVVLESVGEVDRFIGRSVATLPHVTGTRTPFVRRIFLSGSKWELGGLDAHERQQLRLQRFGEGAPLAAPTALHRRVMAELYADVRIPASEIARRLDKSVTTISEAISDLLRAPCARWAVDVAQEPAGLAAHTLLWLRVAPPVLDDVGRYLASRPQTRSCVSLVGAANLHVAFRLSRLADLDAIEGELSDAFPRAMIVDRWMIPRSVKRQGYVLTKTGLRDHFASRDL